MDSKIPSPDWQDVQAQKLESSSLLLFLLALLPKVAPGLCSARKTDHWSSVPTPSPQQSPKGHLLPSGLQGSLPNKETTLPHAVAPQFSCSLWHSHCSGHLLSHKPGYQNSGWKQQQSFILLWFPLRVFHEGAARRWLGPVSSCRLLADLSGIWTENVQKAGSQNIWSSSGISVPAVSLHDLSAQ